MEMDDRFPEAKVSILLAEYLLSLDGSNGFAEVAIDGASVKVGERIVFPIQDFLSERGWFAVTESKGKNPWTRQYSNGLARMEIHSKPGSGDVVACVGDSRFVAECKKGPPSGKRGSPERPLLHMAIGQAVTFDVADTDVVLAAVPDTLAFRRLAEAWRKTPLIRRSGIRIVLVSDDGEVDGL